MMGDIANIVMSMDITHLMGAGVGAVGFIGLVAYVALKKKSTPKTKEQKPFIIPEFNGSSSSKDAGDEATYTVNTQSEASQVRPRISEVKNTTASIPQNLPTETSVAELFESALVFDKYGNVDEATEVLKEAIQKEAHPKEKVRLHVIYKNYITKKGTLAQLAERYPSFFKPKSATPNTATEREDSEEKTIGDEIRKAQEAEPIKAVEKENEPAQNDQDTQKFFSDFGDLAKQIQSESNNLDKPEFKRTTTTAKEEPVFDVWANYMSMQEGRMSLKNTFVHLDNAWGTVAGIAELQEKINQEIGKDRLGNPVPWAIVSVLPIKDNQ